MWCAPVHWDVCVKTAVLSPWELAVSPPRRSPSYLRRPAERERRDMGREG